KPHAIVDDVVKLAVAEILRVSLPHIRGLRIQTLSNGGVPASIIAVANRAMIGEVRHGIRKHFRAGGNRVRHLTRSARHCDVTQLASKKCLSRIRFVARAEAAPHDVEDRKSTRLNSSHVAISYAVFCLKKKKCNGGRVR